MACAQSSEQAKQTGRQTQAGKQSDTGRQAVRLAGKVGKHIGRRAGIALVVLLLCVLLHGSARGIIHLREVRDFRGRAPVESELSGQ